MECLYCHENRPAVPLPGALAQGKGRTQYAAVCLPSSSTLLYCHPTICNTQCIIYYVCLNLTTTQIWLSTRILDILLIMTSLNLSGNLIQTTVALMCLTLDNASVFLVLTFDPVFNPITGTILEPHSVVGHECKTVNKKIINLLLSRREEGQDICHKGTAYSQTYVQRCICTCY